MFKQCFLVAGLVAVAGAQNCTNVSLSIFNYSDFTTWTGACATGQQQSPIDLPASSSLTPGNQSSVALNFSVLTGLTRSNNGHALEVDDDDGSTPMGAIKVTFAGNPGPISYTTAQLHMHWKSEHTVGGQSYDGEIHLVHSIDTTQTLPAGANYPSSKAVVGIWLQYVQGAPNNTCLNKVFATIPPVGCGLPLDSLDMSCFAPQLAGGYWSYNGSLTTPPCTEVVTWFMMATPMIISSAQLAALQSTTSFGQNNRTTQKLNGRTIYWTAGGTTAAGKQVSSSNAKYGGPAALLALAMAALTFK